MSQDAKHDYHLVNPSPWPLVGSVSATVLAVGLVVILKGVLGIPKGTPWVFVAGLLGVLATMFFWWSEVIK